MKKNVGVKMMRQDRREKKNLEEGMLRNFKHFKNI